MTKKKGIASKLFIGLTGLTLLSCCFLGTTFARYTSGGSGTAEVGVALWNVDFKNSTGAESTTMAVNIEELSPSAEPWTDANASDYRKNETGKVLAGSIVNNSDVSAEITIVYDGTANYKAPGGGDVNFDADGYSFTGTTVSGTGASLAQVNALFGMKMYYSNANVYGSGGKDGEIATTETVTMLPGDTLYFYVEVTWTSASDGVNGADGMLSDTIDTWVGMNIGTIGYTFSFTAVQASELP